jgi:CRP-like cAMP-binding protein
MYDAPGQPRRRGLLALFDTPAGTEFLAGFQEQSLPRGYLIAAPGRCVDQVFIVQKGRVRVYLADDSRELTLAFLEAGDVFSTHTPAYAATSVASKLLTIETRQFAHKLTTHPDVVSSVMRVLGKLLNGSIEQIESLVFRDVSSRLAHFLLQTVKHQGQQDGQRWLVSPFPWSVVDLALLLGATRQTVSEAINQMERDGVLERRRQRMLIVHDLSALTQRSAPPVR